MPHSLFSLQNPGIVLWSLGGGRLFLTAILLLGGSWASAADAQANEKAVGKEFRAQLRAYLPAIRCKALLENERQSVAELKKLLMLSQTFVDCGLADSVQAGQVEEELLRGRLRLLRRDREYRDSLDQLTHRFKVPVKRLQEMENATILPLANLFHRFEKLSSDSEGVAKAALGFARSEDVAKARPGLVKLLTTSALVKDTTLPKRFRKEWAEWEKIERIDEISDKLSTMRRELMRREREDLQKQKQQKDKPEKPPLLDVGNKAKDSGRDRRPEKHNQAPQRDDQSLKTRHFSCEVGSLEMDLRIYERQPWKSLVEQDDRPFRRLSQFRRIITSFHAISNRAYNEQFERLFNSWPSLSPARIKEVDLIVSDDSIAEATVTRMLKTLEAQGNGKKKVRQLRTLAKSYYLEQRLFRLAFVRRTELLDALLQPKSSLNEDESRLIGPLASRPSVTSFDAPHLLDAYRSLSRARRRLLQTWIDYQIVRLDLYRDLGLAPPDR